MKKNYFIILSIIFCCIACKGTTTANVDGSDSIADNSFVRNDFEQNSNNSNMTKIANPAATRCVDDGYKLEPVIKNGVTVEYICVNPETGPKCEVWRYFRDECSLKPKQ